MMFVLRLLVTDQGWGLGLMPVKQIKVAEAAVCTMGIEGRTHLLECCLQAINSMAFNLFSHQPKTSIYTTVDDTSTYKS